MPLPKDQRPGPTTWSYLAPPPDWLPVLGNAPTEPRPLCLALAPSHRASVGKSSLDLPTPGPAMHPTDTPVSAGTTLRDQESHTHETAPESTPRPKDESRPSNDAPSAKDATAANQSTDEKKPGQVTTNDDNTSEPDAEDESKYLTGFKLAILSVGLCLTTFVIALDNTIIATAIPKITSVFNSLDDVGWYGSAYLLTTTSLQPSFGRVYTYFDVKYTYLSALVIFELSPVLVLPPSTLAE
ncbi:hypothetical protein ACJQWK_05334 [Exserohilum turcicum]